MIRVRVRGREAALREGAEGDGAPLCVVVADDGAQAAGFTPPPRSFYLLCLKERRGGGIFILDVSPCGSPSYKRQGPRGGCRFVTRRTLRKGGEERQRPTLVLSESFPPPFPILYYYQEYEGHAMRSNG